jgi:hypothetical protein
MKDRLLEWMSYRSQGNAADLPPDLAVAEERRWLLEDMAVLGHIEVDFDGKWRIAPPTLADTSDETDQTHAGVICGARTRGVTERLFSACELHGGSLESSAQADGRPDRVVVSAPTSQALSAIAASARMRRQRDAGFSILACLPAIRSWPRTPCPMVEGNVEDVSRFSKSELKWKSSSLDAARQAVRGLFRIKRDWTTVTLIKSGRDTQAQIDLHAGRLAAVAGAKRLHLDLQARTLRLPLALKPPILISRALTLCSGALPEIDWETRQLIYRDIPIKTARLAVSITGLRLA